MIPVPALFKNSALVHRVLFFFVCTTISAVIIRYCFSDAHDPSKCGALLNEGIWLDHPSESSDYVPKEWQPPGCMVHSYNPTEVSTCFANRRLVFAGDSTIRQLFWAVAKKLDPKVESKGEKHSDITVERSGVKLEFIWDPYLNGSAAIRELGLFDHTSVAEDPTRPAVMIVGTGLWFARFEKENSLKKWKDSIDGIVKHMPPSRTSTDLMHQDFALLAPVPIPAWDKLNEDRKKTIKPELIREMNSYLQQLSDIQGAEVIWSFFEMTASIQQTFEDSGIHVQDSIAGKQAEVILNLRCNAMLPRKYPYDKTCCNKYGPPNIQQWAGLIFVLAILPVISYLRSKADLGGVKAGRWVPSEKTTSALLVFGFAVVYCFYADRTQVFNKFHKHYTTPGFLILTAFTALLGFLTLKKSSSTATDQAFLFRDQTDEWKGWMQFAILIYHYTGASKVAWIYGFIRITVASYLFMTGYGHTIFFYKKGDYSFKRIAGVMIRLNLLSCVLPYMMKTDYLFYYFAPLVSMWFFVVYFTMRIGSKYNSNMKFLFGKIFISAVLVTAFTMVPGILEAIFNALGFIARTEWNVKEWRFRVFLDMWIVYIGMIVAIVYIKLTERNSPYAAMIPKARTIAIPTSVVALILFFLFQSTRENKFIYNSYHPYISWIPILSFITLRNATPNLRNTYSGLFAWIGKCSLETFTLQFHIWMAADTHGLLDLGIFGPHSRFSNFVISTILFLYTSDCVSTATGDLTAWIMGMEKKPTPPPRQLPITNDDVEPKPNENGNAVESVRLLDMNGERSTETAAPPPPPPPKKEEGGLWKNLKFRCAALLLWMWILNVTYR